VDAPHRALLTLEDRVGLERELGLALTHMPPEGIAMIAVGQQGAEAGNDHFGQTRTPFFF
jgi:hypothetical protein